ncbi:hypothetical protein HY572_06970 [Candidatus Micrarchaeota archaeon]|nr:hypothetical protein [Candidatus Micrarchaeota archaeon]
MANVMVAVVGPDSDVKDVLELGLQRFPSRKIVLLFEPRHQRKAESLQVALSQSNVRADLVGLDCLTFETVFESVARLSEGAGGDRLILNVDADHQSSCIMLSAAFVNGVQAIGLSDGAIIAYPIMKFSYYHALSERKSEMLRFLVSRGGVDSLESMSKALSMSLPLVTYHVHGSNQKPGLVTLGLVDVARHKGRLSVRPTALGNLIVQGLVCVEDEKRKNKKRER